MAGVHEGLKTVQRLHESMIGSADRAEQEVAWVQDFAQRVEQVVRTMDRNAERREARVGAAYERLEHRIERYNAWLNALG